MDDPDVMKLQKLLATIAQSKPPVGKQQIVDVSKAALTAIRHFKHVVHLIEKFILKCKSHHKLYGFYMIDSIVRQAQKKFKHKDVFGPRFAINLRQTLENALSCSIKERPKIVRLLNLWSANNIFEEETLRPLLQHCRASGLDVDPKSVEEKVKGDKADMSRYGSGGVIISPMKAVAAIASNSTSSNPDAYLLNLLSSINSEYDRIFANHSRAFRKVQDLLNENVKKHLNSQSKNKIQNILSADFDYSDDDSGDENKTSIDINSVPKEQIEKTTESLFKNPKILEEIRNIFVENGGAEISHGSSSKYEYDEKDNKEKDRKRKRSRTPSRDRKEPERRRERSRRSKERERSRERSHRRRSSSPPRHREDKRDKERRRLGFPQEPRKEHFILGSSTIWIGRLPCNCSESEIKNALSDFGIPEKIQIINSRACAYVVFPDRRTAYKVIDKMSNKLEVSRKPVKLSWATSQGLKDDKRLNAFWDSENGYYEIPWNALPSKIGHIFEGGYADLDTLPSKFRDMYDEKGKLLKGKTPDKIPEPLHQQILSQVPLPPPENPPVVQMPPPPIPTGVPPPMPSSVPPPMPSNIPPPMSLSNFQPGLLQGLNLQQNFENKDANTNLELLMAAVANGNNNSMQPGTGILGAPPINSALLNTLNALNVRPPQFVNVNRPPFPRMEGRLPDQQAAFQQFRGNAPRPFGNELNNQGGFNIPRHFNPRNNFNLPDMNTPPPMNFSVPPPSLPLNFTQPPPNIITAPPDEDSMDIASPDGPPGV